jgi:GH15 family glucan-1,4-alpha-glucosidase
VLTDADRVPLGARAWIGDGRTGALVAADGTIDWYCPGRFDAAPTLARLLDPGGGAVRVGPVTPAGARRAAPDGRQRYRGAGPVAETDMAVGGARLRVTDFMPWSGTAEVPAGRIVRIATAVAGPLDVEVEVVPGGPWGPAREVAAWAEGLVADTTAVRTGFALHPEPLDRDHPRWRGVRRLAAGESMVVTVDDARQARHGPLAVDAAFRLLDETLVAWDSWLGPLVVAGPYAAAVRRAVVTVRSLTPPASGAPVAAPTTSLARRAGGERTADDRLVRWHDAAAAVGALAAVGFAEEAEAAEAWLRRAVEATDRPWSGVAATDGGPPPEREEIGLAGWRRSQPVVVGEKPGRVDLDVHGDVAAAVSACRRGPWGTGGDGPLVGAGPELVAATDWVADNWTRPDAGRWAGDGRPVRLVASTVQAWVALDLATRRARAANPLDLTAAVWQSTARTVLGWLETDGLAADGGLRRDPSPADAADAALLRVAWRGPWPTGHPIVERTVERTLDRLSAGRLVHRVADDVDDGRAGPDSPDLVASLWAVRALAHLGRWEEAHERMEAVLAFGGGLGLLAEAADPQTLQLAGNFPSTAAHLAVIEAAVDLDAGPR